MRYKRSTGDKHDKIRVDISRTIDNVHNVFTISLLCSGNCIITANGKPFMLEAPMLLCIKENADIKFLSSSESIEFINIYFNPAFINKNMTMNVIRGKSYNHLVDEYHFFQLSPFINDSNNHLYVTKLNADLFCKLKECYQLCIKELESKRDTYWSCRTRSFFMEGLSIIERLYYDNKFKTCCSDEKLDLMVKVKNHIDSFYNQNITVEYLCNKFYVSKTFLEVNLKKYLNTTVTKYIHKLKLENACNFLRFTSLGVNEISIRVGFQSAQSFCSFFKKHMKITPTQFRSEEVGKRIKNQGLISGG